VKVSIGTVMPSVNTSPVTPAVVIACRSAT
jgi:hypothetical protein